MGFYVYVVRWDIIDNDLINPGPGLSSEITIVVFHRLLQKLPIETYLPLTI